MSATAIERRNITPGFLDKTDIFVTSGDISTCDLCALNCPKTSGYIEKKAPQFDTFMD